MRIAPPQMSSFFSAVQQQHDLHITNLRKYCYRVYNDQSSDSGQSVLLHTAINLLHALNHQTMGECA